MFVLLRHGIRPLYEQQSSMFNLLGYDYSALFLNGWVGVDLFFVLSGFLVGFHLLRNWPDHQSVVFFLKYWLKRVLRTFPLYYLAIAIAVLGLVPFYQHGSDDVSGDLYYHLVFLQDYFGADFLAPLWSLATEEKFYLLCPFLVLLLQSFRKNIRIAVVILLILSLTSLFLRYMHLVDVQPLSYVEFFWEFRAPFHFALDGLILGVCTAFIYYYRLNQGFIEKYWSVLFYIPLVAVFVLMSLSNWMDASEWGWTVLMLYLFPLLFSVLMTALIHSEGRVKDFFSSSPLRFISRLSYSLYLSHMLVLPLTQNIFNQLGMSAGLFYSLSFFTCFIVLSVLLSVSMHLLVEKPFLAIKDRISLVSNNNRELRFRSGEA